MFSFCATPTVILDGLFAKRLVPVYGESMSADLNEFGGREELHLHGITDEGLYDGTFLHDNSTETFALGPDGAGQPHGAGADDNHVRHGAYTGGSGVTGRYGASERKPA